MKRFPGCAAGLWGSDAGQSFTYVHFNRLINKYDIDAIYVSGPARRWS